MKSFVLQKFSNNEVRVGWQDLPSPKKKKTDSEQVKRSQYFAEQVALTETEVLKVGNRGYLIDRVNGCSVLTLGEAERHELARARALDITAEVQRNKRNQNDTYRPGWGKRPRATQFGAYARHTILEAGATSERRNGHISRGVEVTLTIPGHSDSAFAAVSEWSGYLINRILQPVRRHKTNIDWFYCWELQKRGALHVHLALAGDCTEQLLRVGRKVRKTWWRALEEVARKSGVDLFVRRTGYGTYTYKEFLKGNRVAEIRKSLAAYFAKYTSKNATASKAKEVVRAYYPSRWWGISRQLFQAVKKERLNVRFTGLSEMQCIELLDIVQNQLRGYNPVLRHHYNFELSYGKEGNAKALGIGGRWLYWFARESFDNLQVWLPTLLRYLMQYCSNGVMKVEGDIEWMLRPSAWNP